MGEETRGSHPCFDPVPLGQQPHLSPAPSAVAAKGEYAAIGFLLIAFVRGDRCGHGVAAGRTLKEKNVNEPLDIFGHGNLPSWKAYKGAQVKPIRQVRNLCI
jgi:hypothetical protein